MKTIKQLREEGTLSYRTYKALVRGMCCDTKLASRRLNGTWNHIDSDEYRELTVKDVFDLFTENEMMKWKGFGPTALNELKGLV
jgi:hypothetical protein